MAQRLDHALAVAAGASVAMVHRAPRLCRENRRVSAALTNAGMAEISVRQLKFRGLGIEQRLDVADKLPGTEASASVKVTVPKNAAFSVHQSIFTMVVLANRLPR